MNTNNCADARNTTDKTPIVHNETRGPLTCERCGQKTDGGAWLGFIYVGAECLTSEDQEYIE